MESFGFGNYSPGVNFMLMPTYYDALKVQAIELNDQIRKSAYSFELIGNDALKIFPIPNRNEKLYFDYVVKTDRNNPVRTTATNLITNVSNVPYTNITYNTINSPSRSILESGVVIQIPMLLLESTAITLILPNLDNSLARVITRSFLVIYHPLFIA